MGQPRTAPLVIHWNQTKRTITNASYTVPNDGRIIVPLEWGDIKSPRAILDVKKVGGGDADVQIYDKTNAQVLGIINIISAERVEKQIVLTNFPAMGINISAELQIRNNSGTSLEIWVAALTGIYTLDF